MREYGIPAAIALIVWWFSTGIIIFLDLLPRRTHRVSMIGMSVVTVGAFVALAISSASTSVLSIYLAFGCGVVIWGWHEMSFFMGFVTGPRRHACSRDCGGWRHFLHGVQACLWHELAIKATAVIVLLATAGGPNQVGVWTFMILWAMRQSAKLNVFLGVRNLNEEFLPAHLRYIASFMRRRRMNWLMPFSLAGGSWASYALVAAAANAPTHEAATGLVCLATMTILGVIEHAFLVIPLPFAALWDCFAKTPEPAKTTLHTVRATA